MIYFILSILSVIFIELFIRFNLMKDAHGVIELSSHSVNIFKSSELSDNEKELFMRTHSVKLLIKTLTLAGKFLSVFAVLFLLVLLLSLFSPELANEVVDYTQSVKVIILLTVGSLIYLWLRNVINKKL